MIVKDKMGEILVMSIFRTLNNTLVYCGMSFEDKKTIRGIFEKDVLSIREKL